MFNKKYGKKNDTWQPSLQDHQDSKASEQANLDQTINMAKLQYGAFIYQLISKNITPTVFTTSFDVDLINKLEGYRNAVVQHRPNCDKFLSQPYFIGLEYIDKKFPDGSTVCTVVFNHGQKQTPSSLIRNRQDLWKYCASIHSHLLNRELIPGIEENYVQIERELAQYLESMNQ